MIMNKSMTQHLFPKPSNERHITLESGSVQSWFHYYFPNHKGIVNIPHADPNQKVVVFTSILFQSIITVFNGKVTALHDHWDTILPLHGSLFKSATSAKMPLSILLFVKQHLPAPAHRVSFITSCVNNSSLLGCDRSCTVKGSN